MLPALLFSNPTRGGASQDPLGKTRLAKAQTGTVRNCTVGSLVTCQNSSNPCHLSSVSARQVHFAVSLGWAPSGQGGPPPKPKSALLNQRSPHHPPSTRPENPSCRRLHTERLPVPQNGAPLRPIVIRYQVTYWLYSPDQGLFSPASWSFDHLPPSSSSSRWSGPAESPFRSLRGHRLGESTRGPR